MVVQNGGTVMRSLKHIGLLLLEHDSTHGYLPTILYFLCVVLTKYATLKEFIF